MENDCLFSDVRIQELAVRQLADYDMRQPGTLFAEDINLNIVDAYRLQEAVADLRVARGEQIIGYKVGCTSTTIRQQLGIDHSITGRLYASECHSTSTELSRQQFANLAIEGELAVELSRTPDSEDLQTDGGNTVGIPECVARIFPVIELHNHLIRGQDSSASELIANNAIHAGFVQGEGISREQSVEQEDICSLQIFAGETMIAACDGVELVQTIRSSLEWLFIHTNQLGEQLEPGQIVLTGSIPQLIPIRENCHIKVETQPFGSVDVEFID